jgi:hypothetical protein
MALEMKAHCETCNSSLAMDGEAYICSYDRTYCPNCAGKTHHKCPRCGGELAKRPRRVAQKS